MKFDVVVAHYEEDVSWIGRLTHPSIGRIFVYTKGIAAADLGDGRAVQYYLPNVGRESHTYLWHCVHNLSGATSDFTFFVQGAPHSMGAKRICEWIDQVEALGLPFTLNYRLSSPYDFLHAGRCRSWAGETQPAEFDVRGWCERYVAAEADFHMMPIFWNACFGVSNRTIADSGRGRLALIMQKELGSRNPECGHYCERLWFHILGMRSDPRHELPEGFWHFWGGHDGRRHHGIMRLSESGSVMFYDNENERTWRAEGDSIVLFGSDGRPTSVLKGSPEEGYSGRFLGGGGSTHRLTRRVPV